ncbi:ferrous iron transport protein B [bacterium]|nr:ferrous iron transport protein B [bacterium]
MKADAAAEPARELRVVVIGNPNAGKTTLFNALTGLRQKVGNYPGVTVERKEGRYVYEGAAYRLIDLPGAYSLTATSDDERIVRDTLLRLLPTEQPEDIVLVVVDATHLERQLFIATQVMDLGIPTVVALTMNDEARRHGRAVDAEHLTRRLGVPVVEVTAPQRKGVAELREALRNVAGRPPEAPPWSIGEQVLAAVDRLATHIGAHYTAPLPYRRQLAVQLLLYPDYEHPFRNLAGAEELVTALRGELEATGANWTKAEVQGRYDWIHQVAQGARVAAAEYKPSISDRLDAVLTHPVWGLVVFLVVMAVVFQSIFTWSGPFMDGIDWFFGWLGGQAGAVLPAGPLRGLIVDGLIPGVGGVVIFLPQILILFLAIALLEDSGYMARAAFLMNKHMQRAGLHGRAFIPMLSGFACSIPGIMAARTIPNRRDKLVTMLVVPMVSCSARLPVYALMIAAFVPALPIFGFGGFTLQGVVLWLAYMVSLGAAITVAFIFRKTLFRGQTQPFVLELPPYRVPHIGTVLIAMWERGKLFITQAGTIILAINIILWFLLSYPSNPPLSVDYAALRAEARAAQSGQALADSLAELDNSEAAERISLSYGGRLGRALEPAIKPLGFDWKIGIGLVGSLAAREVFVSTLAVAYGVGEADETDSSLIGKLRADFGLLTGLTVIIFFILSCQCLATVAVMKREANSLGWALFLYAYMTTIAYLASLVFYQVTTRIWPHLA